MLKKFEIKHKVATGLVSLINILTVDDDENFHCSLMYHSILETNIPSSIFEISSEKFGNQIELLKKQKLISFASNERGISITFDDGYLDNYTIAAPLLLENKIPFTIFMVTDFLNYAEKNYLNKEHLKELSKNSLVTIGAHGRSHRPLTSLSSIDAKEEMRVSKLVLEDIIGKEVTTMSFPHGSFNQNILDIASELGYKKCGTSIPKTNRITISGIQVNRQCIYSCESLLSFKQKINGRWNWIAK